MVTEVSDVLARYGLHPPDVELVKAFTDPIARTPDGQGGRLRPDGTVDRDEAGS